MVAFARERLKPRYHVVLPVETEREALSAVEIAVFTNIVHPGDARIVNLAEQAERSYYKPPVLLEVIAWLAVAAGLFAALWRAGQ